MVEHALVAAAVAKMGPERQCHLLRRALQWTVEEAAAAQWWVKSHEEVLFQACTLR